MTKSEKKYVKKQKVIVQQTSLTKLCKCDTIKVIQAMLVKKSNNGDKKEAGYFPPII